MADSNGKQSAGNRERGPGGRFAKGNPGGPGRPSGRLAVEAWRTAFAAAVSPADVKSIVAKLVKAAKAGERWAIEQVLDRCCGSLVEADLSRQVEELEALILEKTGNGPTP